MRLKPSLSFWAPYIGPKTRKNNFLFNTEYRKLSTNTKEPECECRELTEERLLNTVMEGNLKDVKDTAEMIGISTKGSKLDIVNRIKRSIQCESGQFNKIFKKMFGCSGGWLTLSCKHGIIYAVKFLLRSESPRDYIDILRSLKYRPNILINDMAHMVANFGNRRHPGLFAPYAGRAAEATHENIELAVNNSLQVSIPWLESHGLSKTPQNGNDVHPVTGSDSHLALFDRLHESNIKREVESLRRIACVKELFGKINSEAAEQLHGVYDLNMHFLNQMHPLTHIFMFRSLIDLNNENANFNRVLNIENATGLKVQFDTFGRMTVSSDPSKLVNSRSKEETLSVMTDCSPFEYRMSSLTSPNEMHSPSLSIISQLDHKLEQCEDDSELSPVKNLSPGVCGTKPYHGESPPTKYDWDGMSEVFSPCREDGESLDEPLTNLVETDGESSKIIDPWLPSLGLDCMHKEQIKQCLPISVEVINAAMGILQSTQDSKSTGFQKIEGNCNFRGDGSPFIQIVPLTALTETWVHWGTLSNIFSPNGHVTLYDCARRLHYRSATREIRYGLVIEEYAAKLRSLPISELVIDVADTKTVGKNADSGVAAICYAFALVKGADPQKINFNYKVLRKQLVVALENSSFDTFTICLDGTPKSHRGPLYTIEVPLFCNCKMPDNGSPMIACDSCNEWFHVECVQAVIKRQNKWFCENCTAVGSETESQHAPLNKKRKEMAMSKGSKRKKGKRKPICLKPVESPCEKKVAVDVNLKSLNKFLLASLKNGSIAEKLAMFRNTKLPVYAENMNLVLKEDITLIEILASHGEGYEEAAEMISLFLNQNYGKELKINKSDCDMLIIVTAKILKDFLREEGHAFP